MKLEGNAPYLLIKHETKNRLDAILTGMKGILCAWGRYSTFAIVDELEQFRRCLIPLKSGHDDSRLPIFSLTHKSKHQDKAMCVYALISFVIQLYWRVCREELDRVDEIKGYLDKLERINELGLDAFEIRGEQYPGYFLEAKE